MPVEPSVFDDEKLTQVRGNEDDPIIQYYIIRTDVGMSLGKILSQVAHGAQMFVFGYLKACDKCKAFPAGGKPLLNKTITEQWLGDSFRTKVTVKAKTKDFEKIKELLDVFVVRDAGLTEVEPGTETVIVTWPMHKSVVPKVLQRLRLLKELNSENNG